MPCFVRIQPILFVVGENWFRSFSVALFLLPRPPLVTPTPHAATGSVVAAAAVEAVEATATGEEATAVAVEAMVEGETTGEREPNPIQSNSTERDRQKAR